MKLAFPLLATLSATALAGPIEPDKLPQLNPKPTGRGAATQLYSTKLPVDHVVKLLMPDGSFVMVSDQSTFEGRIDTPVPLDAALGATRASYVVPARGGKTVDFDFYQAPVKDLILILAAVARADLIYATTKPAPKITIRVKGVDATRLARDIIKLAGLEMIERAGAWVVVDQGTVLDPKLAAVTAKNVKVSLNAATAGEIQQLIDPKAPAGVCATDRTIDARINRGQTGLLLAVAAQITGPACTTTSGVAPKDGKLVGILREGKGGRIVVRHAKGTLLVTPDPKTDELGDNWVMFGKDAIELYPPRAGGPPPTDLTEDWRATTPCGTEATRRNYVLRATAKVGKAWRALLVSSDGFSHLVTEKTPLGKATISAGKLQCDGGPSYQLTAP